MIAVAAQGEVVTSSAFRRPDSDAKEDRFRLYEIAGASHIDRSPYYSLAVFADQAATGGNVQATRSGRLPPNGNPIFHSLNLPLMTDMFDAALTNLDLWVRKGISPRRGPDHIGERGAANVSVVLDPYGIGKDGVRSPYADVPTATYFTNGNGPGACPEMGYQNDI